MNCPQCHTLNFRGFKFCRECGQALDWSRTLTAEDREIAVLLENALQRLEEGEYAGARAACLEALETQPQSAAAHSLLSVAHEREGNLEEAIRELEVVLELSPESVADRERLDYLRGTPAPRERRWVPILQAVAAAVITVAVVGGIGWAIVARPWEQNSTPQALSRLPSQPFTSRQPLMRLAPTPPPANWNSSALPTSPNQPGPPVAAPAPTPPQAAANPRAQPRLPRRNSTLPTVLNPRRDQAQQGMPAAGVATVAPLGPEAWPGGPSLPGAPGTLGGTGVGAQPGAGIVGGVPGAPGGPGEVSRAVGNSGVRRELLEPESGFIRIEPAASGPRVGFTAPSGAPGTVGATPEGGAVAPAPGVVPPAPSIAIRIGGGGPPPGAELAAARAWEGQAFAARQQGDLASAQRLYGAALQMYESIARRGGVDAATARAGMEGCRRALSGLAPPR